MSYHSVGALNTDIKAGAVIARAVPGSIEKNAKQTGDYLIARVKAGDTLEQVLTKIDYLMADEHSIEALEAKAASGDVRANIIVKMLKDAGVWKSKPWGLYIAGGTVVLLSGLWLMTRRKK